MKLHRQHVYDEHWEGEEIAREAGYRWIVLPMLFNVRLIAAPEGPEGDLGYDYGWCYPLDADIRAAVAGFDPETQDEPKGWHKRAAEPRRAPQRHKDPQYNRPRCLHGEYLGEGSCSRDPLCPRPKTARARE